MKISAWWLWRVGWLKMQVLLLAGTRMHVKNVTTNAGLTIVILEELDEEPEIIVPLTVAALGPPGSGASLSLLPCGRRYHVFLTHDWGKDEHGRNNHERVKLVNARLQQMGMKVWFDEERMEGNIVDQMCRGIEDSAVVAVFITERYVAKVSGENAGDNCKKEFNYATQRKTNARMVPVVMEPRMQDTSTWTGAVGMELGPQLYTSLVSDAPADFADGVQQLFGAINSIIARDGGTTVVAAVLPEDDAHTAAALMAAAEEERAAALQRAKEEEQAARHELVVAKAEHEAQLAAVKASHRSSPNLLAHLCLHTHGYNVSHT